MSRVESRATLRSLYFGIGLLAALPWASQVSGAGETCVPFLRGDANADGAVDIADVTFLLSYGFRGGVAPTCLKTADVDADGEVAQITDAVRLLSYQFLGGVAPVAPFPSCDVVEEDDGVSCESYVPCANVEIDCGGDPDPAPEDFEWIEIPDDEFSGEQPAVFMIMEADVVAIGETLLVEVVNTGDLVPVWIEWGDGARTPVLEDDIYEHSYSTAGDRDIVLVDAANRVQHEAPVHVEPAFEIVEFEIVGQEQIADPFRGGILGEPVRAHDCAQILPPNLPGWQESLRGCGRFLPGDPGPQYAIVIASEGHGVAHFDVRFEAHNGQTVSFASGDVELQGSGEVEVVPLPPLPTSRPGTHRVWFDLSDANGEQRATRTQVFQVVDPVVRQQQDCDWILLLHAVKSGQLAMRKSDCDNLRRAIAALEAQKAALEIASTALGGAITALADQISELDAEIQDEAREIQALLGDAGTLTGHNGPANIPAGSNFVGAHGLGVVFSSPDELLSTTDLEGNSILSRVNGLAQKNRQKAGLEAQRTQAEANLLANQAKIAGIESRISDLRDQLADCERKVSSCENDLTRLEEEHEECLLVLAEIRRLKNQLDHLLGRTRDQENDAANTDDRAEDAGESVDGSAGSGSDLEEDHETIAGVQEDVQAANDKRAEAKRLLEQAGALLGGSSGDRAEARTLVDRARRCLDEADGLIADANSALDEVDQNVRVRGVRECREGEVRSRSRRDIAWWTEVVEFQVLPLGHTPESMGSIEAALESIQRFLELLDLVSDYSPIEGTFTPEAGRAAEAIFNAFRGILLRYGQVEVYALLEGRWIWKETRVVCRRGKWVAEHACGNYPDRDPVRGWAHIGNGVETGRTEGSAKTAIAGVIDTFTKTFTEQRMHPCTGIGVSGVTLR